ncbi:MULTISPECIES: hypothetical protein [unclassified Candidatus Tisiphia]|uniref:hypothetical protein n=1 Tax=unclassified Candidatus Tisiphia TaxID=2996318 RepID=UPI0035C90F1E
MLQDHYGICDPTKKAAKILKQQQQAEADEKARQEDERLAQEAKLKEQEEAKEIEEAAKLKAIEEAKVKEYVPEIQVVKLFEVADGNNQFDNDDQATIKQVSNLIRDGNDRLQEHGKNGILLLGNTGAGKTTLAHVFSGRELQAIFDDETNEMVIEAKQPFNDIVIGHKMASETKIPNKCFAKDKNLIIWDCPGFNDTDPVQEIANSFYIKRLFETTEQLKFVLVVDESYLRSNRGSDFLETLSNFIKSFNNIEFIKGSISLVFTHVPPNKNIQHIKNSIDKILKDNQGATEGHKALINKLKDNGSIHLFYKPTDEGELAVPDLLAAIDTSSKYSDAKGDMVNITISKKAQECSSHLLNTASNNFNQLLEVIVKAIGNATKCSDANSLNAFSENYHLVKDWIPSSIHYNNLLQRHNKDEYFLELDLLSKLQKVLNCEQIVSIPNAIMILQQALEIFAEYAKPGNVQLQHQIQGYGYCLQQQYEYVKFFASVCGVELPDHAKIAAELITACHAKVIENLEYQVSNLPIDEDRLDQVYYHKAIKYLEDYPDSPACKNLKAIAYSCLASIAEQNGENEALDYYVKAIEANSHLPKIYEKLGQLFFNKGEYAKAIDCYKVINNAVRINECFKAWIKQDAENPDIMLKQAEYFESVGLFEQAKKYYHHAFSLSSDENFKAAAYKKIGNIMANVVAQGQDFITRADEHDFYNYDLVDAAFTSKLLGDSSSECDL